MATDDRSGAARPRPGTGAAAALVAATLSACAGAPLAPRWADARARVMEVPEGRALVYVFRPDALEGPRTLPLYANSERIGDLPRDAYCVLEVEPGELRLDFPFGDGATSLRMRVDAGRRYYVRQEIARRPTPKELRLRVETARLAPVDEASGRRALGRLLRTATVRTDDAPDPLVRTTSARPDRALLVVYRRLWWGEFARPEILVNGRSLGSGAARSFVLAEARPGRIELALRGDDAARLTVDVEAGGEVFVEAVPRAGLFGPRFELRRVDPADAREALAGLRVAAARAEP